MKGLIYLARIITEAARKGGGVLFVARRFAPPLLAGAFLFFSFLINIGKLGYAEAFKLLSTQLLLSEQRIAEITALALSNSLEYGFLDLLEIMSLVTIVVFIPYWIMKALVGVTGSQAKFMAFSIGIAFYFVVAYSASVVVHQSFAAFIPLKDGLWFMLKEGVFSLTLFRNLHPFGLNFARIPQPI